LGCASSSPDALTFRVIIAFMRPPQAPILALLALAACSSRSTPAPAGSAAPAITAERAVTAALSGSATASASPSAGAAAKPPKDAGPPKFSATTSVDFRPDGQALFVASGTRGLIVPLPSGATIELPQGPSSAVTSAFSHDGAILAVGYDKRVTILYDTSSGARLAEIHGGGDSYTDVHTIEFSHDDKRVAVAGGRVELWDVKGRKMLCSADAMYMWSLAFSPDGKWFAGTGSHRYEAWDTTACKMLDEGSLQTGGTFPSTISPDAAFVASAEGDGHDLVVYKTRPFKRRAKLPGASSCQDHVGGLRFSPSGVLFSSGNGHWIRTYDTKTLRPRLSWKEPKKGAPERISMLDDGVRALVGPESGPLSIVDMKTGKTVVEIAVDHPLTLGLSPDDAHLASVSEKALTIWDVKTGKEIRSVKP
jgi:WD40 repeat protein